MVTGLLNRLGRMVGCVLAGRGRVESARAADGRLLSASNRVFALVCVCTMLSSWASSGKAWGQAPVADWQMIQTIPRVAGTISDFDFDSAGNLYFVDESLHRVTRTKLDYQTDAKVW